MKSIKIASIETSDSHRSKTKLMKALSNSEWNKAIERINRCPGEVSIWQHHENSSIPILPLHFICTLEYTRYTYNIVRKLLEVDPETSQCKDRNGRLPLHYAVENHTLTREIIELLIRYFPESLKTKERLNNFLPIHMACYHDSTKDYTSKELQEKKYSIIKTLLQYYPKGARHKSNEYSWIPLHIACRTGASIQIIQELLQAYPNGVKCLDSSKKLPIHHTCSTSTQSPHMINILNLLSLTYPNGLKKAEGKYGFLPLHTSICSISKYDEKEQLVQVLLSLYPEAASTVSTSDFSLPIHLACRVGSNYSIISELLQIYPEGTNILDHHGRLPLHWACHSNSNYSLEVIKLLLSVNPYATQVTEAKYGYLSLHVACSSNYINVEVVKSLLNIYPGAIHCRDVKGSLPIHLAIANQGNGKVTDIIRIFLEHDKELINTTDGDNLTPLQLAMKKSNPDSDLIHFLSNFNTGPIIASQ